MRGGVVDPGPQARQADRGRRAQSALLDLWCIVLTLLLTWPMWRFGGYGLARDLVFTPRAPLDASALGLGSELARSVPLDAVLGLLSIALDGAVVFRLCVAGVLLAAGCGAHRLVAGCSPAARAVVVSAALWNPFVVERLALGQWALLGAYAALWWLLPALRDVLTPARALDSRAAWGASVWWIAAGSLTPSGGLMIVLVTTASAVLARGRAALSRCLLVGVALLCQLPWLVPSLWGAGSAVSDPEGVVAFAARAERPGGVLATLLGGGGIWSPYVVPGSLTGVGGYVFALGALVAIAAGGRWVWTRHRGIVAAAAVGFVLAALAALPGGRLLLEWVVAQVPGGGLLRDGQKWVLPYVVFAAASAAPAVDRLGAVLRRRGSALGVALAVGLTVLPVAAMPDGWRETWSAVEPVRYPQALRDAVAAIDASPRGSGEVLSVPLQSYRRFSWGNDLSAPDPAARWVDRPVVVSDRLQVEGRLLAGEDPRVRRIERSLDSGRPVGPSLAAEGIGWLLVYTDQPGSREWDGSGLALRVDGEQVRLYAVPDVVADAGPTRAAVVILATLDLALLALAVGSGGIAVVRRSRRACRFGEHEDP